MARMREQMDANETTIKLFPRLYLFIHTLLGEKLSLDAKKVTDN
jgi:hypothetical protein